MVKSRASKSLQSAERKKQTTERNWSNTLKMWHVCANTACGRARCCRGSPSYCYPHNFPRLPEGVQDWFLTIGEFQAEAAPFDDAWAELTRLGLVAQLANWQALVHGSDASGAVN